MSRLVKILYGFGALALGVVLSVALIKTAVSHDTAVEEVALSDKNFPDYIEQLQTYYSNFENRKGHFHQTSERFLLPIEQQENCLTCHSLWPHKQDRRTRAFNNQHSRYMSCMVCHIDTKVGRPVDLEWYDFGVDNSITRQGPYGIKQLAENELSASDNFISKIVPVIRDGSNKTRVFTSYDTPLYSQFRDEVRAGKTVDSDKIRKEAEGLLGEKAMTCSTCHDEASEFPWDDLGFSGERLNELQHSAVVGMVEKYDSFYFPAVFE